MAKMLTILSEPLLPENLDLTQQWRHLHDLKWAYGRVVRLRARTKPVQTPVSISKIDLPPVVDDASVTLQFLNYYLTFRDVRVGFGLFGYLGCSAISRLLAVFVIGYLVLIHPSVCG